MPLDEALKRYVDGMPDIYKDIFRAFPEAEPGRRRGDSLLLGTIAVVMNEHKPVVMNEHQSRSGTYYHFSEIEQACRTLASYNFFRAPSVNLSLMLRPTPLGEDVIEHLSGHAAPPPRVPELGPPPGFVAT